MEIFAIKDTHTSPAGRLRAEELLNSEGVNVFFIEWARPIDKDNIDGSFTGLAPEDAEPNLKTLAALAISKGIEVVPCDLSVEETLKRLNENEDDKYAGTYKESSVFQPWGKAVRDQHAADVICDYMHNSDIKDCSALVMFGSDHFEEEDGRGVPPLNKLIKEYSGIDCFMLKNR